MLLSILLAAPEWLATYRTREQLLGRGLGLLGAWALLNLVGSGYWLPRTDRREVAHHFHFMNCCWGFINAVLAAVGILRTHPGAPPAGFTAAEALHDQQVLVLIFQVNAALDIGYLLGGLVAGGAGCPPQPKPHDPAPAARLRPLGVGAGRLPTGF